MMRNMFDGLGHAKQRVKWNEEALLKDERLVRKPLYPLRWQVMPGPSLAGCSQQSDGMQGTTDVSRAETNKTLVIGQSA